MRPPESEGTPPDLEHILAALVRGEQSAFDELVPLLYDDLRRLARSQRRGLRVGETLDTTALVHETYLKLAGGVAVPARDRDHLLAILSRAMRQVLVDAARRRAAAKRGGDAPVDPLDEALVAEGPPDEVLLDVESALEKLRRIDERLVRVVECRFYGGLTEVETSRALDISVRTVHRDWMRARGWLRHELDFEVGEGRAEERE